MRNFSAGDKIPKPLGGSKPRSARQSPRPLPKAMAPVEESRIVDTGPAVLLDR
jgi:hypothetical protein